MFEAFAIAIDAGNWPWVAPFLGEDEAALHRTLISFNELRNTLSHSRPVSEFTRREGEAALARFKQRPALA